MKFTTAAAVTVTVVAGCAIGVTAFAAGRPSIIAKTSRAVSGAGRCHGNTQTIRMMSAESSAMDFAKSEIAGADVVVFSKSFCPFCKKTKKTLKKMDIDAKIIELDEIDNGAQVQDALLDISGQRTVPNVFIKGQHLGGNDDTQKAAREGKLQEMLGI